MQCKWLSIKYWNIYEKCLLVLAITILKNKSDYWCADLKVAVMWFFIVCDSIIFNRNSSKQVSPKLIFQFYFFRFRVNMKYTPLYFGLE